MSNQTGITSDLTDAVDQLHDSLQRATDAAARIRTLLPQVNRIGAMFQELESIIDSGRQSARATQATTTPPAMPTRPTLVVPGTAPASAPEAPRQAARPPASGQPATPINMVAVPEPSPPAALEQQRFDIPGIAARGEELISFRLEFESRQGPLDLRAVDDAVSEHPAVRDVALLDYDGRRATLKVWIASTASVAEVQQTLSDRAGQIIGNGGDVSIVALEDAA